MYLVKSIHKWVSVIVGIQFLIWLSSGIFFNMMDDQKAKGSIYRQTKQQPFTLDKSQIIETKTVLQAQQPSQSLKLIHLLNQPYYLLTHQKGLYRHFTNNYSLINAYTGKLIIVDEKLASNLAVASYKGPGKVISITKMLPPIADMPKEKNTVWQINFDDQLSTSVYIDSGSGYLIMHSNDDKRFADFFFMLHFMDYGSVGDFNNWQIIFFAIAALWLVMSGVILMVKLLLNGGFKISYRSKKIQVEVKYENQQSVGHFTFSSNHNLLDALFEHDIILSSSCGGGGSCGKCKIKLSADTTVDSADRHYFTEQQLAEGYRLACQHYAEEIDNLSLLTFINAQKYSLKLTQSTFLSPLVKELKFEIEEGVCIEFKSGAHMRFFIPSAKVNSLPRQLPEKYKAHWQHIEQLEFDHLSCSRNYSLVNYDTQTHELVFAIKIQSAPDNQIQPGVGSNYLCNMQVGQTIEAVGPFEEFYVRSDSGNAIVLIGAGAGMSPLKSLAYEQLEKFNNKQQMHFYFGARTERDLIYVDEFTDLAQKYDNFTFNPILSQPGINWAGDKGYVQHFIKNGITDLGEISKIEFYLCGPKSMMQDTIELLRSMGVKDDAIAFDDFNPVN